MLPSLDSLSLFHPLVRQWFEGRFGAPTEVQSRTWPAIAAGQHALVTAPTGSGKTLTAFLWALDQLLRGVWPGGRVRVLYVSPLKALNSDIERNLKGPLQELEAVFLAAGTPAPEIRVQTRSGDTPPEERRRMIRRPPEILITTPESLNILLTSRRGRQILDGLATVILDEIHAVAGSKRGTHLMTAVERLVPLSGEFQRIAISATIRPMETIAEFIGGYRLERVGGEPQYRRRSVTLIRVAGDKKVELVVKAPRKAPLSPEPGEKEASLWSAVVPEFRDIIRANRSTLLFANSRRMTERVTRLINEDQIRELAYSHHGSLSREIRGAVESRLKAGELSAIVATNSLELGIDIGDLDEVVLIQTPPSVASAVQRLGRAGHGVGQVSRGRLYPTHERDILQAAVVGRCVLEQDIESVRPVESPLDILAQVIVSMVAEETWPIDELYAQLRTSFPYHHLKRHHLDLVLQMLAGRYAGTRVRELRPRIFLDRAQGTVRGRDGVARLVYLAGGTIPDRGYYSLRLLESGGKLGELDEEFVWERSIGDSFTLGAQSWQIQKITHNDVLVTPAKGGASLAPFWRADERDRSFHLSEKVLEFLRWADPQVGKPELVAELRRLYPLEASAATALAHYLEEQKQATGCPLPHRHHLVVELYADSFSSDGRRQMILHTLWGGKVNRPLAIALAAAWEEKTGTAVQILQSNDSLNLLLGEGMSPKEVLSLVDEDNLERLLRQKLEETGFFGARFRHAAACALLLPRASFRRRMPLWLSRLKSKKLLEGVAAFEDFPVVLEAWRTCLQDEFELEALRGLLGELRRGEIRVSQVYTETASPFAADLLWKQTNQLMYEDDTPGPGGRSRLREDLVREVAHSQELRPRLAASLAKEVEAKLQRLAPGYSPRSVPELVDWVEERVLVPIAEWPPLLAAMARDHALETEEILAEATGQLFRLFLPGGAEAVVHPWQASRLGAALGCELPLTDLVSGLSTAESVAASEPFVSASPADPVADPVADPDTEDDPLIPLFEQWLRAYGPQPVERVAALWGLEGEELERRLAALVTDRRIVVDSLLRSGASAPRREICDSENLERLLRLSRRRGRPHFEPLPLARLPLFLAHHQGLTAPGETVEDLQGRLESLFAYPARAEAWETEILPCRMAPYFPGWLDGLLQASDCYWLGCGEERVSFAFGADLELLHPDPPDREAAARAFPDARGRFTFEDLLSFDGGGREDLHRRLWSWVWQGLVSSDSLAPLRRGLETGFAPPTPLGLTAGRSGHGGRRLQARRWQRPPSDSGSWFLLPAMVGEKDALDEEELRRQRVRLLLDRYGILFRELLAGELAVFQWSRLFRTLRLMELSGEVLAGHFFTGVPGLQFISHEAFRRLQEELPGHAVYWLGAQDPISPCGLDLPAFKGLFPARRRGAFVVFRGETPVVLAEGHGRRLDIRVPADDPALAEMLGFLQVLLSREVQPMKALDVEEINGLGALESPYGGLLKELFSATRERKGWRLRKSYSGGKA